MLVWKSRLKSLYCFENTPDNLDNCRTNFKVFDNLKVLSGHKGPNNLEVLN